jgi:thymidylate synthase
MKSYLELVDHILTNGELKPNRTGVSAFTVPSAMIQHDMSKGFPLLTTKKIPTKTMMVELEGFIKGFTSKKWYQDRGCKIWNEWCNPQKVPYGNDEESKKKMLEEDDLGKIYGYQWRTFNNDATETDGIVHHNFRAGDQFASIIDKLHNKPEDRRMICSAWNPLQLDQMALPPCHILFNVIVINKKIHLNWYQRSCDTMLGIPFNLASYALLLHLLACESGFEAGTVTGMLGDTHIYENHVEGAKEQLKREPKQLPEVQTPIFTNIFDWQHTDTKFLDYNPDESIKFDIAV